MEFPPPASNDPFNDAAPTNAADEFTTIELDDVGVSCSDIISSYSSQESTKTADIHRGEVSTIVTEATSSIASESSSPVPSAVDLFSLPPPPTSSMFSMPPPSTAATAQPSYPFSGARAYAPIHAADLFSSPQMQESHGHQVSEPSVNSEVFDFVPADVPINTEEFSSPPDIVEHPPSANPGSDGEPSFVEEIVKNSSANPNFNTASTPQSPAEELHDHDGSERAVDHAAVDHQSQNGSDADGASPEAHQQSEELVEPVVENVLTDHLHEFSPNEQITNVFSSPSNDYVAKEKVELAPENPNAVDNSAVLPPPSSTGSAGDLFGATSNNTTEFPPAPQTQIKTSAANLFGDSAAVSDPFTKSAPIGGSPTGDLFSKTITTAADSLFSSMPPPPAVGNKTTPKMIPKVIPMETPALPASTPSPFDSLTTSGMVRPAVASKPTTKVVSNAGAADLFSSTNSGNASLFGSTPSAGPPSAAKSTDLFAGPPPSGSNVAPSRVQPSLPPSITIPHRSPNSNANGSADKLFGPSIDNASPFDAPSSHSSLDLFSTAMASMVTAPATKVATPKATTTSSAAADLFGSSSSGADLFGPPALVSTVVPPAVSAFAAAPPNINRSVTEPANTSRIPTAVPNLNRTQSADGLFGESNAAVDAFGVAPSNSTDGADTSVFMGSLPPTPVPVESAPPSSSSNSGKSLSRVSSSGAIFKGKASLVTNASPFDAPASSSAFGQKDLFPQTATASNPFDAIPAPALPPAPGQKPTAWDIFSNKVPPAPSIATGGGPNKAANPADIFASAPVASTSIPSTGSSTMKPGGGGRAVMNAAEIFSRIPPPNKNPVVDFSSPPPAPGVKVLPKPAPVAIPPASVQGSTTDPTSPSPIAREVMSPAKPPVSNRGNPAKSKLPAHLLNAIPGAIPTPHGLAAPPSSVAPSVPTHAAFGGPSATGPPTYKVHATPLVNPNKLTSLVQVVPEEELHDKPPPVVETPPLENPVDTAPNPQLPFVKGKYIKPASAICAFGFGGKCLTMIPNSSVCPPVYASASKQPQSRILSVGMRPSALKAYKLIDLMGIFSGSFYKDQKALPEVMHWKKLVCDFPVTEQAHASNSKDHSEQFEQKMLHFIRDFSNHPSSTVLSDRLITLKSQLLASSHKLSAGNKRSQIPDATSSENMVQASGLVHDLIESEKLLWSIMEVSLRFQGKMSSSKGCSDTSSPEYAVVQLLLQQHHQLQQQQQLGRQLAASPWTSFHPESFKASKSEVSASEIEQLLVSGRRDEALALAIDRQDWALALMLASIAGAEKYQEVIKLFAQHSFPANSALQLLSLVYSNQAQEFIATNGHSKPKSTTTAPGSGKGPANAPGQPKFISTHGLIDGKIVVDANQAETKSAEDPVKKMGIFGQWRYHLAALLSNKTSDWESLVRVMGNRLLVDYDDHFAAAIAYICANMTAGYTNPTGPPIREELLVDLSLLGNDRSPHYHGSANSRLLADCLTIACLRRSEVLEYALSKQLSVSQSSNADGQEGGSGKAGLASSVFGWFTSSNANTNTNSNKGNKDIANKQKEALDQERAERFERLTKLRVSLCPLRVRFAMVLADYGLYQQALQYTKMVNHLVKEIHDDITQPPNKRKYVFYSTSPFPKKFVRALEELMDRFGLNMQEGTGPKQDAPNQSNKGGSLWGLSSVISTTTLKEIMDGPSAAPTATMGPPPTAGPPMNSTAGGPPKAPAASAAPPMGNPYVPAPFQNAPQPQPQPFPPVSNNPPVGNATAPQSMGFPPMPAGRQPFQNRNAPMSHMMQPAGPGQQPFDQHFGGQGPAAAAPTPAGPSVFVPGQMSTNQPQSQQQQPQQQPQTQQPQQSQPQPPLSPAHGQDSSSNKEKTSNKEKGQDKEKDPLGAGQKGIVGNLRKGLMQWFYPDAHDASDNIGNSLEAYYDNKLGRWVFPGEEDAAQNNAALKPPPTGPMPGAAPAGPAGGPSVGPPGPGAQVPAEAGASAPYDPLAALMAPPPRAMPAPAPSMADDPLAAMMAPPPARMPGRPSMGGSMMPPAQSAAGAPPGAGGPPVNKFNVWKPPPVAASAATATPAASAFYMPPMPEPAPVEPTTTAEQNPGSGAGDNISDPSQMAPPPTSSYMYAMPAPPTDFAPPEAF